MFSKKLTAFTALILVLALTFAFSGCDVLNREKEPISPSDYYGPEIPSPAPDTGVVIDQTTTGETTVDTTLAFDGKPFVLYNKGTPNFLKEDKTTEVFERYSPLDSLGRCGVAYANLCKELMPTEERGSIGSVKPSGWQTVKYDCVDGKYLYNRCHLIGFQLAAENANEKNLITGTRYLNIEGMLPFENMVADYIKETDNHVLYRVTPIYDGNDLVASGVIMEGWSVEDNGDGICFSVYCFNAQPSIEIDYRTGESRFLELPSEATEQSSETKDYILNTNSKKFHLPTCSSCDKIADGNKEEFHGTRDELIADGYAPCGICKP